MENQETTRRSFYSVLIAALGTLIGAALAIPAGAYLLLKPKSERKSQWVDAADFNSLHIGKPEEVVYRRKRVDGWRVVNEKATAWVVRTDEKNVVAFTPSCTHLGCAYHWDEPTKNFVCPCHTSAFSMDGKVLAGPAPRPLDRYVTRVENGKLLISPTVEQS
jgi:menaquinol-cytochrome c reductase iron-sulfur subunit